MILGISGKIAAGKTEFAKQIVATEKYESDGKVFELSEAKLIEVDELAHSLYEDSEICSAIHRHFGDTVFERNRLSRKKLSEFVFYDLAHLYVLEQIVHPRMRSALSLAVKDARALDQNLLVVAALPITFHFDELCDVVIPLDIDRRTAWERVQKRNPHLSELAFATIWQRQASEYPCSPS